MPTDSLVSQNDALRDEIKLAMAEQLNSAATDFQETRSCMFLRNGRSHAWLISTYNWPPKLSLGYLVLTLHSEAIAGSLRAALMLHYKEWVWDGDRRTPKVWSGWSATTKISVLPTFIFHFSCPPALVTSALSSAREAESAFG